MPQAFEDYELNEVYKGVYVALGAGVAGAAGTAINGIRKAINDNVTAGRITPIVTGAPSATNTVWVDQVEDLVDKISLRYQHILMNLAMQPSLVSRIQREYRAKYGKDTDYKGSNGFVYFSIVSIVGLPSMIGSNKLWATTQGNGIHLGKRTQNKNAMEIESVDRKVKFLTDHSA
ncbi:hypothetical protein [Rufibacter latericius]|uniref:hypothetical protein n=1 Tax=Rufibacter latericius TaxID=2487040 RepID=UPI000F62AA15|nr:hypothetical protein [Rufibacter latericius]